MGKIIKFILAVVLLVLFAAGGFAVYLFLSTGEDMAGGGRATADARRTGTSIEDPKYLELGDFIVNLADGRRYLKTNLQLLLSEQDAKEYLAIRQAEVKDLIVAELQTYSAEELRDPRARERLKDQLLNQVNSLLPNPGDRDWDDKDPIKKVLMTEFYLQ